MMSEFANVKLPRKNKEEKYDMCKAVQDLMEDGRIEGRIEGRKEGREEGRIRGIVRIIIKKVEKNKDIDTIAEAIEEDVEYIRPIYDVIVANPKMDESEVVKILQKKKII